MKRISIRVAVLILSLGALVALDVFVRPVLAQRRTGPPLEQVNGRDAAAREALIKFRDVPTAAEITDLRNLSDADLLAPVGRAGVRRLRSRSVNAAALIQRLAARPNVLYAEPNYIVRALTEPNDPSFPQLWGLKNIGQAVNGSLPGTAGADIQATQAWDLSLGSTAQVVAVVDSGIDYTHPDLAANMWSAPAAFTVTIGGQTLTCPAGSHGFDALAFNCDPMDDNGHGTHVAGTIGASGQNGVGVAGVNWIAQLMAVRFVDASGQGTVADAINALDFTIQAKQAFATSAFGNIRVISASWGGSDFSQALLDEVNATNAVDMLFVAAAGNSGISNDILPTYPASFDAPNIIAVAATTNTDARAWFSNYGASSVHLGAPGVDILSTIPGGSYQFQSGTSMAAPHVSGAAALVLSRCTLDTAGLKDALLSTVDLIPGLASLTTTGGRLNVNSAIHSCSAPPDAPSNLVAVAGDASVKLTWAGGLGATSFLVKRSLTAGGPYAVIASSVKVKNYLDQTAVNGTTYYYVVSGSNSLGESGDSNEASATPKAPTDLVVSALTVPATGGAGTTLMVSETTSNQSGSTGSTTTRFYLSRNGLIDANARTLDGFHTVPPLATGASSTAPVSLSIPTDVTSGLYYVIAKADADNVEAESKESNNTLLKLVTIGPDLAETAFSAPQFAAPGSTIVVTDTAKNQGGGAAGPTTTRFYLSTNALLDPSDQLLTGGRSVPALAAGDISAGSTAVILPSPLTAGTYYVFAKADADNAVSESQESNNAAVRALLVGGDLTVSALTVPTKAAAGGSIVVSDTTANTGAGGVTASTTRFYLSTDITLSAADIALGGRAVPDLSAGTSSSGATTLSLPSPLNPGTYYLFAKADADNAAPETQEANNTAVRVMLIGPDLVVSGMSIPFSVLAGATISVTNVVSNPGADLAGQSTVRFYLSSDTVFSATADILLAGSRLVPSLAAGASSSGATLVTIPLGTAPGNYYVFAIADADGVVGESTETNNFIIRALQIVAGP